MLKRLKTLPLTIVLTILIWMYAEAQFTATHDGVQLSVKLVGQTPDLSVRVYDGKGVPRSLADVTVTLEGPKSQVDAIAQKAHNATADDEINSLNYEVPARALTVNGGDNTVDTAAMLNSLPYFRQRNVWIMTANPARLKLQTDTVEKVTKTVEFEPSVAVSHFSIMPEQVTVSIPSRTLQDIGGAGKIKVLAIPQPEGELATLPPDSEQTVAVRFKVEYPGLPDDRVAVGPVQGGTVELRLPRRAGVLLAVPDVPVWVAGPPGVLGKYDVELRTKVVRVLVSGSEASINSLQQRMALVGEGGVPAHGVRAYLDILPEDKAGEAFVTRKLRYVLPEGLTMQDAPVEGEFRLAEKVAATQGK